MYPLISRAFRIFRPSMYGVRRAHLACVAVALSLCMILTLAQAPECSKLATMKASTYGFHPTDLNQAQQLAKSSEMDRFWAAAKSDHANGIQCSQQMILAEKRDKPFLFDASSWLYSLDNSPENLNAITPGLSCPD